MKTQRKLIALLLCLAMLASVIVVPTSAYSAQNGEFVFSDSSSLSYLSEAYSLDVTYSESESDLKLSVNGTNGGVDPRVLLDLSSYNFNADDYKSLLVIYKVPTTASGRARSTELFISAGTVTGPTAGKSVTYSITKSSTYTSQIVDLSSLSWWKNKVHSIRFDCFTDAAVADTMYVDSIMLCSDYSAAMNKRDARLAEIYNVSTPDYSDTDLVCTKYDYQKYTSPVWKGNVVYNEAVYPIKSKDGGTVYKLMYTPDQITSVYSADFSSKYYEGIDYVINGDEITFLTSGSISFKEYNYIHPQSNPNNYSWDRYYNRTAAGDGKWEYWGQSAEFFNGYINVSYTHSDTWDDYVPPKRSADLPITANKIANGGSMKVVFFGDSICGGANSSSYRDVYPYAEFWNEMIVSKLRKDYGCRLNATYSAEGGGAAPGLVSKTDEWVTAYAPDLVFIEFGVNDAMNWSQDSSGSASGLKAEYKSAIIDIIEEVRDTYPKCEFVLVAPFYSNPYCHYMSYFEACRDALNEIADVKSGVTVADVTAMHESLLEYKDYLDFSGDNMCHPNDFMARLYAQVCLETIVPGGVEPYTADTEAEPPSEAPSEGTYTDAAPAGYGWQWGSQDAYGLISGYGTNGQDIDFTVDLSLIDTPDAEAKAIFYTASDGSIEITPNAVKVAGRSFAYDWGTADISNWHTVNIKIKNGAASVSIDGENVASISSGVVANTQYQLFFSYTGCMAIDNMSLRSSGGTTYVDCDFENAAEASNVMGGGLGTRTLLAANTVSYDTNGGNGRIKNQIKVRGTALAITSEVPERNGYTFLGWSTSKNATTAQYVSGDAYTSDTAMTLYAVWQEGETAEPVFPEINSITPESASITDTGSVSYTVDAAGEGLTYKWTSTNTAVSKYLSGTDTKTLTVNINEIQANPFLVDFYCTVTNSDGNSTDSTKVNLAYFLTPAPSVESITPTTALVTDKGTASFTVKAEGKGLTYNWTCSDSSLLPYITGLDSSTLTVQIDEKLAGELSCSLYCTVKDEHGRTAVSDAVSFNYELSPEIIFNVGDVNCDGKMNAADCNYIKRVMTGQIPLTDVILYTADMNGDGAVNSIDINLLVRRILGE